MVGWTHAPACGAESIFTAVHLFSQMLDGLLPFIEVGTGERQLGLS